MADNKVVAKTKLAARKSSPKKPPGKKAPPKRKPAKPDKEYLVIKIVAIYWEQFGRGAELAVETGCFERAVELGAMANVRKNLKKLSEFGADFKQAEKCSLRAGRRAAVLAGKANLKTITPDIYQQAFEWVAAGNRKLAGRSGNQDGPVRVEGMLC